ncbi:hypothetical protein G8A07_14585 [Roseateles sp. DAIF2]|uniref:hypothetical protein n=1 Tax=Roseateles sp. DAIF2 TaxID=2714952 RepID=UPI0018A337FE|nr:hypothetical protein [Roseateles sp. DAIF2]QPF74020.1 hypothetical protein G8A07_14585 [Roseateles sp. DAIF2]
MSSSQYPAPPPDQRFIDKQMAGVIEAIMIHGYSLANKGFIPSEQQVAVYISSLNEETLLQRIRRHPGAAATRARLADDAELLRWARLVGRDKQA